jgi:hypothetical protein
MPENKKRTAPSALVFFFALLTSSCLHAQMITGVWKGRINKQKVEVKIIQNGDNLTGTSYYHDGGNHFRRYSIKGYFDPNTNEAVWWDDQLLEEKTGKLSTPGKIPMLSRADFNCPGDGSMMLDGKASRVDREKETDGLVDLDKTSRSSFSDEWDYVIDNFTLGTNDPYIIDSIGLVSIPRQQGEEQPMLSIAKEETNHAPMELPVKDLPEIKAKTPTVSAPTAQNIQQKFTSRKKVFATEIPLSGDSVELRFYDNAQIDGDSISLFLNDQLLFEHIRLTEKAYTIRLAVAELYDINELIMVAENLGSIPPNTSYMVAIMNDKRYEARLESTEGSSALIRLVKNKGDRNP